MGREGKPHQEGVLTEGSEEASHMDTWRKTGGSMAGVLEDQQSWQGGCIGGAGVRGGR